jgi:hypothetical protein
MARKHNTRHEERGRSHYGRRLTKRGITKSTDVMMPDLDTLRRRAGIKAPPIVIANPTPLRGNKQEVRR